MRAVDDVPEESLRLRQPGALLPDPAQPLLDDPGAVRVATVEYEPDLREAHPDTSARLHDAEATDMLVGVLAMTRRGAIGNDDPLVVPVPQDVRVDADPPGGLADPHRPTSFPALTSGRPEVLASAPC
nr:hypothetical protein [Pseudonocardia alni]